MSPTNVPSTTPKVNTTQFISFVKSKAVENWVYETRVRINNICNIKVGTQYYWTIRGLLHYLSTNDVGKTQNILAQINESIGGKGLFTPALIKRVTSSEQNWQYFQIICVCLSYNLKISDLLLGIRESKKFDTPGQHQDQSTISKPLTTEPTTPEPIMTLAVKPEQVLQGIRIEDAKEVVPKTSNQIAFLAFIQDTRYTKQIKDFFAQYRGTGGGRKSIGVNEFYDIIKAYNKENPGNKVVSGHRGVSALFGKQKETMSVEGLYDGLRSWLTREGKDPNVLIGENIYRPITRDWINTNLDTTLDSSDGRNHATLRELLRIAYKNSISTQQEKVTQKIINREGIFWEYLKKELEKYNANKQYIILPISRGGWIIFLTEEEKIQTTSQQYQWKTFYHVITGDNIDEEV